MSKVLKGKIAIITGAGQGLGQAFALKYAESGAALLLADINFKKVAQTADQIKQNGGKAVPFQTDISDVNQTEKMAEKVMSEFGRVDILLNNAGITKGIGRIKWNEWPIEEWDRIFAVNVKGTWLCCRAVAPVMISQGKGKIINITSNIIKLAASQMGLAYACSKAAIYTLTQTMARELGPSGIQVNGIAPGRMNMGPTLDQMHKEAVDATIKIQCLKRQGKPSDIADTALFLASPASDYIAGQIFIVDGGAVLI